MLSPADLDALDVLLAPTDRLLAERYPGDDGRRQPVHTVYVPADRFHAGTARAWGDEAARLVTEHDGWARLAGDLVRPDLADDLARRAAAKLATDPVEDLRIDLEDGYGLRDDDTEDADVVAAAHEVARAAADGLLPRSVGLRVKCLEAPLRRRSVRTLGLFLTTLLEHGPLPTGLVTTLPKVSTAAQVEAMRQVCERLETALGLAAGVLRFEVQVETPPVVLGADGRVPLTDCLTAGQGRVTSLHYGTYDYSASIGVAAGDQSLEHPAADLAKGLMQLAVAGTGVHLSDGSTNVVPTGDADQARAAWALHHRLVRRSLSRGIYQGWDLHPGHLPTRYLATFGYYREGLDAAATRLSAYLQKVEGDVMDEPATAKALSGFVVRALRCGAVDPDEVDARTGLGPDQLDTLARTGALR
ncbi:aldolase/citrate lyase family protein [uncultured Nocardioides sp.]|uniref:DUF6986 family protein n=1 Tax=uncultured Nocardioides sp. TaxID=198441 RepID=UPI00263138B9|nr:aldolase/citrate lyase family protein [uncultured Nocardioides sp.]